MEKKQKNNPKNKSITLTDSSNNKATGLIPIGTIVSFILETSNIPEGWLLCDGKAIDGNKYPEAGNNSLITKTPNLGGLVLLGTNPNYPLNSKGGSERVTLSEEQMPPHTHKINFYDWGSSQGGGTGHASKLNYTGSQATTLTTGGSIPEGEEDAVTEGHNNMQPYYSANYIIYVGIPA